MIRLLNFVGYRIKKEKIQFSKEAVYARDNNICQYWHIDNSEKQYKYRTSVDDRTIDHVLPVSRGDRSTFENCVTACCHCNECLKKNHTPAEVGMTLIRKPTTPKSRKGEMAVITFSFNRSNIAVPLNLDKSKLIGFVTGFYGARYKPYEAMFSFS